MVTVALSTRDNQKGDQAFCANLAMVGHKAHGYPDKISVPYVDRRDTGGRSVIGVPLASSPGIGGASLVTQVVKNPPAVQETQV